MPFEIKVNGTEQVEELKNKLMRWSVVAPKELEITLRRAAELVIKEVKTQHLSGPKMPRGVGADSSGFGNATLGVVTGTLRRSINKKVSVTPGKISATVGTNVKYAPRHEFGQEGMPERPFLRPSLAAKHDEVFKYIREAFLNSYGK